MNSQCLSPKAAQMAPQYFVSCVCGSPMTVELFEAGTSRICQKCNATIAIPSSVKLQQSAGETSLFLSPIQKLRRAVSLREAPFDGPCHCCQKAQASVMVPVILKIMDERHVAHDDIIGAGVAGGLKFVVAPAVEHWANTVIPLMLCDDCHQQFRRAAVQNGVWKNAMRLGMTGLGIAGVYFVWHNNEQLAWTAACAWLTGALIWAFRSTNTKKVDAFVVKWLQRIRWVPDILAAEDEFRIMVGSPTPIVAAPSETNQ